MRPAVSCTRDGADWPKVVAVGAQQPISDFFGFIQMRDTLSTNGEHLRVAEVKSFPAIPKSMRSINGDQNGANLKKWSVLLVCTIPVFVCEAVDPTVTASPLEFKSKIVRADGRRVEVAAKSSLRVLPLFTEKLGFSVPSNKSGPEFFGYSSPEVQQAHAGSFSRGSKC